MARRTYVCLDSNILFRFVTQASPKFEEHLWDKLLEAKKHNEWVLLIPEVIVLEIGKLFSTVEDDIKSACKKVRDRINKAFEETPLIWNELSDAKESISKFFESWETDKLAAIDRRKKRVLDLLQPAHSTIIPYDQQIHFSGHRRFVAGTFPKNPKKEKESRNYEDCCIIESLVSFFKEGLQNKQLLFVTENYLDFGIDVADERTVLHPLLTSGLPASQVFKNLESLITFLESKRPIKKVTDEEIENALESIHWETEEKGFHEVVTPAGQFVIAFRDGVWKMHRTEDFIKSQFSDIFLDHASSHIKGKQE
ncbi:MAG: hypothetical protein C0478_17305 [Planctomyces sp.]|nr:hypothetical protein [Planctomyces sp.]